MVDREVCQSYIPESGTYGACRDGFPQTAACWSAGVFGILVPTCMNEKLCGGLYPQTGEPFKEREFWRGRAETKVEL